MIKEFYKEHIFYLGDVLECLKDIEDNIVDLVFTSPPYNVGINYENWNDNLSYENYLKFLEEVLKELYSRVVDDGRLAINIPSITAEGEYKPLFNDVINIAHKIGFKICAKTGRRSTYIDNSKKAFEFAIKRIKSAYFLNQKIF
jgi:DNA modification methylase